MNYELHLRKISTFLMVYSILQLCYVLSWSIFAGIYAIFVSLISGMAHGSNQQREANNIVLFLVIGLFISVSFAFYSTPTFYRTGKAMLNDSEVFQKQSVKIILLLILSLLINGTTFLVSASYLIIGQLSRETVY
jgi:hypothetical protein